MLCIKSNNREFYWLSYLWTRDHSLHIRAIYIKFQSTAFTILRYSKIDRIFRAVSLIIDRINSKKAAVICMKTFPIINPTYYVWQRK